MRILHEDAEVRGRFTATNIADFQEAYTSIREFLERVYNQKRLHSALGYLPPAEFESGAA